MCWFRPAFAVALDCAATRAGGSGPGQTVRVSRIGSPSRLCNAARNPAMHTVPFALPSGAAGRRQRSPSGTAEALPRHETAHAALLAEILDTVRGSSVTPAERPGAAGTGTQPERAQGAAISPDEPVRPEIADELSVSLNTVGTHIRRIYAKLGTDDRSAAVQRARELRLLSAGRTHGTPRSPRL
jgi:hypothetical protein